MRGEENQISFTRSFANKSNSSCQHDTYQQYRVTKIVERCSSKMNRPETEVQGFPDSKMFKKQKQNNPIKTI
jgi:hypothetical protein